MRSRYNTKKNPWKILAEIFCADRATVAAVTSLKLASGGFFHSNNATHTPFGKGITPLGEAVAVPGRRSGGDRGLGSGCRRAGAANTRHVSAPPDLLLEACNGLGDEAELRDAPDDDGDGNLNGRREPAAARNEIDKAAPNFSSPHDITDWPLTPKWAAVFVSRVTSYEKRESPCCVPPPPLAPIDVNPTAPSYLPLHVTHDS
ncbi:hypothetical protein EVAR_27085_1 [Eumeta japonica]|uniref:Uncharacterized protein n=1 Tax=Eumeta variegata TaxID=151549 RepID=A0A4C1VMY1_EUMVA|nr:hypothetical protein EVAR_27085_1 [Eumeta japonica]